MRIPIAWRGFRASICNEFSRSVCVDSAEVGDGCGSGSADVCLAVATGAAVERPFTILVDAVCAVSARRTGPGRRVQLSIF